MGFFNPKPLKCTGLLLSYHANSVCSVLFLFNMYISISIQIQIFTGIINQNVLFGFFSYIAMAFFLKEKQTSSQTNGDFLLMHTEFLQHPWCPGIFWEESAVLSPVQAFWAGDTCLQWHSHDSAAGWVFRDWKLYKPSLYLGLFKLPAASLFSMSYFEKSIWFIFWTEGSLDYFKCLWVAGLKTHTNGNINLYYCQKLLLIENPIDIITVREWSSKGKMDAVPPHLSALPYGAVHKCEKENSHNKTAVMQCWQPFSEEDIVHVR